jgi:anthranilate synthase/aminodeoxychorismate synthase-like glutamine amidotransferase
VLLVLDNLDSFTFNLVQALEALKAEVQVERADRSSLARLKRLKPARLLVSPGPGTPAQAELALAAIRHFAGRIPVLGVCLGHQALALAFGAKVLRARRLLHGKCSSIQHSGEGVFRGLPQGFQATRYHSLLVQERGLPSSLRITARSETGEIMGLAHASGAEGVQFHPESILTPCGPRLLANFLR